jgi:serine/threonine-protein kinase
VVFGTPDYLSPEQATGEGPLDGRSDLFAVGVLLYELLTGLRPFRAPTAVATAFKVVHADAPALGSTGVHVDPRLEAIVHRLLQKEPSRRFPAALEVIRELDKVTPDAARRTLALARVVGAVRRLAQAAAVLESERAASRDPNSRRLSPPFGQGPPGAPRSVPVAPVAVDPARTLRNALSGSSPVASGASALGELVVDGAAGPRSPVQTFPDGAGARTASPAEGAPRLVAPRSGQPRAFPLRFAGRFQVRGPVLRSVDKVVADVYGAPARDDVIAQLPEVHATEFRNGAINALVAYELEALDAYMERATAMLLRDPARWREFGRLAVEGELYNVVRTLLRPASDVGSVVRRGVSTWARLFSFGTWRVGSTPNGRVTLAIGELDGVAQPLRLWMAGVVEQTMRRAVRADLKVVITSGEQDFAPEMICEIG